MYRNHHHGPEIPTAKAWVKDGYRTVKNAAIAVVRPPPSQRVASVNYNKP